MRARTGLLMVGMLGLGAVAGMARPVQPKTRLIFLDVGQGDSTLVQAGDIALLVDVGTKHDRYDAGARVVVPRLRALGVTPDAILLTHPDEDHVGGLRSVHRAFPRARALVGRSFRNNPKMLSVLDQAGFLQDQVVWLPFRSELTARGSKLTFWAPPLDPAIGDNDASVVLKVEEGSSNAVLMGDAGFREETELLKEAGAWQCQVLKVGHHGSKNSTSGTWLDSVKPLYGIVSCGFNNSYGHPHKYLLDRLSQRQTHVLRTDLMGEVRCESSPNGFTCAPATR